ncbi:phosphotransferase [Streptosporangium sp. CA-135522]|uniref:phosphotransferase n=1 Tax=Streptosporangium sp. CA-135522 TaxID=3240072 RepID=UPI003D8A90F9
MPKTGAVAVPLRVQNHVLATWNAVPTPALLCDRIFDAAFTGEDGWWHGVLGGLARFLGALHRLPADDLVGVLPSRSAGSAWLASDGEAAAGVRRARDRLPSHLTPLMTEKARWPGTPPRNTAVVHGRFSTGVCAPTSPVAILGWREAGIGDPLSDVAYLMGEVLEAAALTGVAPQTLHLRIGTFLTRYQTSLGRSLNAAEGEWLSVLTARRVIDHYAQATWALGPDDTLREVLPKVEKQWLVLHEVASS